MDELEQIFKKLDEKKTLISKYAEKFEALKNKNLAKNELYKQSKELYKEFQKEMKVIDNM